MTAHVPPPLLSLPIPGPLVLQELVGIMATSQGLVLMAPPSGNAEAQKTLAGMLSAIKPKTKVRTEGVGALCVR